MFSRARSSNLKEVVDHYYGKKTPKSSEMKRENPIFGSQESLEKINLENLTNKFSNIVLGSMDISSNSSDNK